MKKAGQEPAGTLLMLQDLPASPHITEKELWPRRPLQVTGQVRPQSPELGLLASWAPVAEIF